MLKRLRGKDDGAYLPFGKISNYSRINHFLMKLKNFAVINAGVAGCCTGLALSFPGSNLCKWHLTSFSNLSLSSLSEKRRNLMITGFTWITFLGVSRIFVFFSFHWNALRNWLHLICLSCHHDSSIYQETLRLIYDDFESHNYWASQSDLLRFNLFARDLAVTQILLFIWIPVWK